MVRRNTLFLHRGDRLALNRETAVSEREAHADLQRTLHLMRQSPRWKSSAACADATSPLSKEFCASYTTTAAKLKGVPQDADPQSALFARMTGLTVEKVRTVLALFLAIACEVISALGLFAILPVAPGSPPAKIPAPAWKPPKWEPKAQRKNGVASAHSHAAT